MPLLCGDAKDLVVADWAGDGDPDQQVGNVVAWIVCSFYNRWNNPSLSRRVTVDQVLDNRALLLLLQQLLL